jgi:hypothetical protein
MKDFANWCAENKLIHVYEDGVVVWQEGEGVRKQKQDLSADYKDYCHKMGTVWPFKLLAKGKGKPVAPVGK